MNPEHFRIVLWSEPHVWVWDALEFLEIHYKMAYFTFYII